MNIEELKREKKKSGFTNKMIAEKSGVPLGTVQKIFGGSTTSPRYDTIKALENVFLKEDNLALSYGNTKGAVTKPWTRQGSYTIDDYYAIPDDLRVELIDGVIYDMAAPTTVHQFLASSVFNIMFNYTSSHPGDCMPFLSPVDVQLDCDNKTMIQPDLIVLCKKDKNQIRKIYGAPDFVLEVLSPSTKKRDLIIKLNKYLNAGVREYWIVDPYKETVAVYDFEHEDYPVHYIFEDDIPVRISGGDLVIDFSDINKRLKDYFGDWKNLDKEEV